MLPPNDVAVPAMLIELFANCALVTVPDKAVVGIVVDAVTLFVLLPYK